MILQNGSCNVEIKIDETYTIGSADNKPYDIIHNPGSLKRADASNTFSILINRPSGSLHIALIGDYHIYDADCAVLEDDMLTILQNDSVVRLKVTDGSLVMRRKLDTSGVNFGIYKVDAGYIIYGEIEVTMLDFDFNKKWAFSGRDIFVTMSGKCPFAIGEHSIQLVDFQDNRYEIDFSGSLIDQGRKC